MQRIIIVVAAVIFLVAGLLAGMSYKRLFLSSPEETRTASEATVRPPAEEQSAPAQAEESVQAPETTASAEQAPAQDAGSKESGVQESATQEKPPLEVMEELIETQFQEIEKLKAELARLQKSKGSQADGSQKKGQPKGPQPLSYQCEELFEPGQLSFTDKGTELLKELAEKVLAQQEYRAMICGHSDDSALGSAKTKIYGDNLGLSVARALEVARGLFALGVPADLVAVCGYGEAKPQAPNDTPNNMAKNRRVEITFLPLDQD